MDVLQAGFSPVAYDLFMAQVNSTVSRGWGSGWTKGEKSDKLQHRMEKYYT
jgi:hypothetical protein